MSLDPDGRHNLQICSGRTTSSDEWAAKKNYSRSWRVARGNEVLVNLNLTCAGGPGIELGSEAGIRTPISWSRAAHHRGQHGDRPHEVVGPPFLPSGQSCRAA